MIHLAPERVNRDTRRVAVLRVLGLRPLDLAGEAFAPGERVTVVATLGEATWAHTAVADDGGAFAVRFEALQAGRGAGTLTVRAEGDHGSSVAWRLNQPLR
jgi:hypothetical protein